MIYLLLKYLNTLDFNFKEMRKVSNRQGVKLNFFVDVHKLSLVIFLIKMWQFKIWRFWCRLMVLGSSILLDFLYLFTNYVFRHDNFRALNLFHVDLGVDFVILWPKSYGLFEHNFSTASRSFTFILFLSLMSFVLKVFKEIKCCRCIHTIWCVGDIFQCVFCPLFGILLKKKKMKKKRIGSVDGETYFKIRPSSAF